MTNYAYVLSKKYSNSSWELSGNEYENLIWKSDDTKPTKKQLDDLWPIVQNEILDETNTKITKRTEILSRLGLTSDELDALLS